MNRDLTKVWAVMIALAGMVGAACSGDDDEESTATTSGGTTVATSDVATSDVATATTEASDETTATTVTASTSPPTTSTTSTTTTTIPPTTTIPTPATFDITVGRFEELLAIAETVSGETFTPRIRDPELGATVSAPEATMWLAVAPAAAHKNVRYTALYSPDTGSVPTQLLAAIGGNLYNLDAGALKAFNKKILPQLGSLSVTNTFTAPGYYDLGVFAVEGRKPGKYIGLLFVYVPVGEPIDQSLVDDLTASALHHAEAAAAVPSIDLGINLVPDEVAPGTYRSISTGFCLVRRLSSPVPSDEDVIVQMAWDQGAQSIITIAPTDAAFENDTDCGTWEAIDPAAAQPLRPNELLPVGTLIVGVDVQPGTYRTEVPPDGFCLVQRLSGFGGTDDEMIEQSAFDAGESAFIEIVAGDVGFSNDSDCGQWEAA
jgi:hypothetical protein